jgi:hypothetical protein
MKSTISLVAASTLVICVGVLMALPRYRASANETAMDARSQSAADSMEQRIVSKEREELDSLKAGNLEVFANLLADDAVFVDAEGPASKEEIVKNVAGFRLLEYSMEGVRFVPISAKSGLITYKVTEKGVSHGKEFTARVYISAVWTKHGGKWICLFSQETTAK